MEKQDKIFEKLTQKRRLLSQQLKNPAAVGFWNMVIEKYSDQAHFIYELLQNADDAKANEVRISLFPDKLLFFHNGSIHFNITDPDNEIYGNKIGHLNAITSIGASSKQEGNTIGKFGVGFKSVFQYTNTPHIEDDTFSFRIIDFIVPEKEERILSDRKQGETLFFLPFKNKEIAYTDIKNKLLSLHKPLLFLQTLKKIEWEISDGSSGYYEKKIKEEYTDYLHELTVNNKNSINYSFIELKNKKGDEEKSEYIHTFHQKFPDIKSDDIETISLGSVGLLADKDGFLLKETESEPAFCFFPTKETTNIKMLLHAPFLLTDNRESIKQGNAWNEKMIDKLALLASDSIELLCKIGEKKSLFWINDNIFDIVPIDKTVFFKKEQNTWTATNLFSPFFFRFLQKLSEAPVFLSNQNQYVTKNNTFYATEKDILRLFSKGQIKEISENNFLPKNGWNFSTLYLNNNDEDVRKKLIYIKENKLINKIVFPENIIQNLPNTFIQEQTTEWLQQFYMLIGSQKICWNKRETILRYKPFIFCSDNKMRAPYSSESEENPQIYLSGGTENNFPCVHSDILKNERCLHFFETQLKLTHPGLAAEIEFFILPRYVKKEIAVTETNIIIKHLNCFSDFFSSLILQEEKKKTFLKMFQNVPFLPVKDYFGNLSLQNGDKVYFDTQTLKCFLQNSPNVYFLDNSIIKNGISPEKRENFYRFLTAIGVSFSFKIKNVFPHPNSNTLKQLNLLPKSLRQIDNGAQEIIDKEIEGFSSFMSKVTIERSQAFMNLLINKLQEQGSFLFRLSLEGEYRYIEKHKKSYTIEKIKKTTAWQEIFETKWLFSDNKKNIAIKEIQSTEQLSDVYDQSYPDLFFFLGITHDNSLSNLDKKQRKAILLIKKFEQNGISLDMLELILKDPEKIKKILD